MAYEYFGVCCVNWVFRYDGNCEHNTLTLILGMCDKVRSHAMVWKSSINKPEYRTI